MNPDDQNLNEDGIVPDDIFNECSVAAFGSPYPPEAVVFMADVLALELEKVFGFDPNLLPEKRASLPYNFLSEHNYSPVNVCCRAAKLAKDHWGARAKTVLSQWNIHSTLDFGRLVSLVHGIGLMCFEDTKPGRGQNVYAYHDVVDFDEAFGPEASPAQKAGRGQVSQSGSEPGRRM